MKNLVLCCDGTWNDEDNKDDGVPAPTNIKKIFDMADDSQGDVQQTRYQSGVGTGGALDKVIGGMLGVGVSKDICDSYQWLADKYEPGDKIFLFGFSRGAFTVRSLAGLIARFGIVYFEKNKRKQTKTLKKIMRQLSRGELVKHIYDDGYRKNNDLSDIHFFPDSDKVHFLGVFDTVGSFGIPDDKEILDLFDSPKNYEFHDTTLSEKVHCARHAVALDEKRGSFTPTLWKNVSTHTNAKQIWFPGVHSDIGGGYKENGLSDCALKWMVDEASEAEAKFDTDLRNQIKPDPQGVLHDSYKGLMKVLRTAPRSIPQLILDDNSTVLSKAAQIRWKNPPIHQGRYLKTRQFGEDNKAVVDVYSKHKWYWTGIYLEPGNYKASASGEWHDSSIPCPPGGASDGNFYIGEVAHFFGDLIAKGEKLWKKATGNERADFFNTKRLENAGWFELVGAIANADNPKKDGTHQLLQYEVLGSEKEFKITKPGYLYCFANDAWGYYFNNSGYVTLTIEKSV